MGALALDVRITSVNSPVFSENKKILKVWGNIENIIPLEKGYRIILNDIFIPRYNKNNTPIKIRLKVQTKINGAKTGDRIKVTAVFKSSHETLSSRKL